MATCPAIHTPLLHLSELTSVSRFLKSCARRQTGEVSTYLKGTRLAVGHVKSPKEGADLVVLLELAS